MMKRISSNVRISGRRCSPYHLIGLIRTIRSRKDFVLGCHPEPSQSLQMENTFNGTPIKSTNALKNSIIRFLKNSYKGRKPYIKDM